MSERHEQPTADKFFNEASHEARRAQGESVSLDPERQLPALRADDESHAFTSEMQTYVSLVRARENVEKLFTPSLTANATRAINKNLSDPTRRSPPSDRAYQGLHGLMNIQVLNLRDKFALFSPTGFPNRSLADVLPDAVNEASKYLEQLLAGKQINEANAADAVRGFADLSSNYLSAYVLESRLRYLMRVKQDRRFIEALEQVLRTRLTSEQDDRKGARDAIDLVANTMMSGLWDEISDKTKHDLSEFLTPEKVNGWGEEVENQMTIGQTDEYAAEASLRSLSSYKIVEPWLKERAQKAEEIAAAERSRQAGEKALSSIPPTKNF